MSEFADPIENQGQEQNTKEIYQENVSEETPKKTKSKITPSTNAGVRASQMVNKKYNLPQLELDNHKVYFIQAKSTNFDRIFRRTPREVNKYADDFIVPLGTTCVETIICAYGLSYGMIYNDDHWLKIIQEFNKDQSFENAEHVVEYLRGAAVLKVLSMSTEKVNYNNSICFASKIQKVKDYQIVENFISMVK